MLKIGLTGGIGSGKSTVALLFTELGIPVIDADHVSRQIVQRGQPALDQLVREFGKVILNTDGSLNRLYLKDLIFADNKSKQALESILHPLIYEKIRTDIGQLDSPYCMVAIPLLIETRMTHFVDRILVVDCPIEVQIERVSKRDNLPLKKIQAILASQVSRCERINHADDIIKNSGSQSELADQVKKLHNLYLSLSSPGQPSQ